MERSHISPILNQRLTKFFTLTLGKLILFHIDLNFTYKVFKFLDKNNDGLINWNDFEAAIEVLFLYNQEVFS